MTNDNNDIMKKIQEDLSKLCKCMDNIEKSVNKEEKMADDISFVKSMMNRHPGEIDPLSVTQSPKTPEGETSLGQGFMGSEKLHDEEEDDVYERFVHLKQKGSVSEYTHEWEVLALRQRGFLDEELVKMYRCGFKDYIHKELKLHKPKTIEEARHAAIIIERKYKLHKTPYVTNDRMNNQFKGKASKTISENTSKYVPPPLRSEGKQQINVERKKYGKCWKCRDKYHPRHKCTTQKLYNCEAKQEEESSEDSSDEEENEENENPSPESKDEMPRISIAAIVGIAQPQTLKLKDYIKKKGVIVMVDSGTTHEFVDVNVVKILNTFAYPVVDLKVMAPPTQVIFAQQLKKIIHKGAPTFVAQCQYLELLSIEGTHQTLEISPLIQRYEKVFQDPPIKLPPKKKIEHIIEVKIDSTPVNVKPYRYLHHHKIEIERLIQELLKHGIITKSRSPYVAPIVLVRKKDESFWLCIDYKGLNKITIKHKFLIPFIDEMLDELHGAEYFSKLDLRSSYYQIRVRLEDIEKKAFKNHEGHSEFKVMPFGLTNAPTTFQATMNELLHPYLRKFVLVLFDDILVYSKTWKEHLKHLEELLSVLEKNQFCAKLSKCMFGQKEVEYLGHIISREGVQVDPNKIKATKEWPKPKKLSNLRGFLGLIGYYRRFIKNYAHLTAPLK
eukprot:PITA_30576